MSEYCKWIPINYEYNINDKKQKVGTYFFRLFCFLSGVSDSTSGEIPSEFCSGSVISKELSKYEKNINKPFARAGKLSVSATVINQHLRSFVESGLLRKENNNDNWFFTFTDFGKQTYKFARVPVEALVPAALSLTEQELKTLLYCSWKQSYETEVQHYNMAGFTRRSLMQMMHVSSDTLLKTLSFLCNMDYLTLCDKKIHHESQDGKHVFELIGIEKINWLSNPYAINSDDYNIDKKEDELFWQQLLKNIQ